MKTAASTGPRLFVPENLVSGASFALPKEQSHYLRHVLRMEAGAGVRLFNGRDGEWQAILAISGKDATSVRIETNIKTQESVPDLTLLIAPVKRASFDFVLEKATELGVRALWPVLTSRTEVREINARRAALITTEAAEQTERLSLPEILPPAPLAASLKRLPQGTRLFFCAERRGAPSLGEVLLGQRQRPAPAAILIGPEGGFTDEEAALVSAHQGALPVSLGPRILRTETAALAALSCWQALCGDWANKEGGDHA